MFDNLRDEAAANPFYEEEAKFQPAAGTVPSSPRRSKRLFGMTAMQRFVIAFMIMLAVCIIGAMALLALGKIGF